MRHPAPVPLAGRSGDDIGLGAGLEIDSDEEGEEAGKAGDKDKADAAKTNPAVTVTPAVVAAEAAVEVM